MAVFMLYCVLFSISFVYQFVDLYHKRPERALTWFTVSAFALIGLSTRMQWAIIFVDVGTNPIP